MVQLPAPEECQSREIFDQLLNALDILHQHVPLFHGNLRLETVVRERDGLRFLQLGCLDSGAPSADTGVAQDLRGAATIVVQLLCGTVDGAPAQWQERISEVKDLPFAAALWWMITDSPKSPTSVAAVRSLVDLLQRAQVARSGGRLEDGRALFEEAYNLSGVQKLSRVLGELKAAPPQNKSTPPKPEERKAAGRAPEPQVVAPGPSRPMPLPEPEVVAPVPSRPKPSLQPKVGPKIIAPVTGEPPRSPIQHEATVDPPPMPIVPTVADEPSPARSTLGRAMAVVGAVVLCAALGTSVWHKLQHRSPEAAAVNQSAGPPLAAPSIKPKAVASRGSQMTPAAAVPTGSPIQVGSDPSRLSAHPNPQHGPVDPVGVTGGAGTTTTPSIPAPSIVFYADRPRITGSESVQLSWIVTNATTAQIDPEVGPLPVTGAQASGNQLVHPISSTTYRLIAKGPTGLLRDATARVEVAESLRIVSFTATPDRVALGGEFVLSWDTRGSSDVSIELASAPQGSRVSLHLRVGPNGSQTVKVDPGQFTRFGDYEYRLTVRGSGEPLQANARVLLR